MSSSGPSPSPTNFQSPSLTIILAVILLIFFILGFLSVYFCRCFMESLFNSWNLQRTPSGNLVGPSDTANHGLDPTLIKSFPTFVYSTIKDFRKDKYGLECAICLVEFEDDSLLRLLTLCYHVFHQECIDLWLESHTTCPVCRRNLNSPPAASVEESPPRGILRSTSNNNDSVIEGAVSIEIRDDDNDNNVVVAEEGREGRSEVDDHNKQQESSAVLVVPDNVMVNNKDIERFSRSHSTGHSIVRTKKEDEEDDHEREDRHTLRVPEHVRLKLIRGHHHYWTGSCTTYGELSRRHKGNCGGFGEVSGFVSNLTGSSMLEIAALSTIIPILILLRHSIDSRGIVVSVFSDPVAIDIRRKKNDDAVDDSKSFSRMDICMDDLVDVAIAFLYCGQKMIITCLCILAVDFRIFPRRYAKVETYGTSWMDLGVGSFVLANALVSRQARNILSMNWKTAIQSTSPLLILGFVRLLSTAGVDYQVHVGEYGVHWNFFFTLAAISALTSIINVSPQHCGILGLLVLVGYQCGLMCGLNKYLLSNERGTDIISQNKEGAFSILGYWGMYLVGVQLGNFLFFGNQSSATMKSNKWARIRVWILSLLFWSLTVLLDNHVERVSRRMCNLPYVTLVLAINLQVLAILMLSDFIPGSKSSILEAACNRNLLATFLLVEENL
ncbi:hypothetical protein FNV43_RR10151 [Rhamnella rubrinervis]|uniref:RING-type E3 ubiquitin transferase n=1 Tax=Rhamnella rubrinervis TaxID=2594499 RepID=A0A8K0MKV5_9ROSA|nr:hypothetical protein FNV43_RR10151 [Rhamnella rubrinervis]